MNSRIQKIPEPPPPQPRVWTSLDLIKWTTDFFKKKGIESARLEAELLLSEVLACPRIKLYVDFEKPVPQENLAIYREFVKRRGETREPLQYILGHTQFIDLKLKVTPAVLIPRPETEILALWAVDRAKEVQGEAPRVLDLCTGSGCLALYVASKIAGASVTATDISTAALAVAEENARALALDTRVAFRPGDLYSALAAEHKSSFDLIVANPPYIDLAAKEGLQPEVRDHEPAQALFAPDGGLACVRSIIEGASDWLRPGGWLGVEFGAAQSDAVRKFAEANSLLEAVEIKSDQAPMPRFVTARRKI